MIDDQTLLSSYQENGNQRAKEELVSRYENLAKALARRYAHRGENLEDLTQVAMLGLLQAIERYSTDKEVAFSSFAVPTILGEIKRYFRDKTWSMRVPRQLQEFALKLEPASEKLSRELGRAPTDQELAKHLQVSIEELQEAKGALEAYHASSLDAPLGEDENLSYSEKVGARDPEFELVDQKDMLQGLMEKLGEREREIVQLRFYYDLSQAEIAEKIGISQMHVSRLLKNALVQLAKHAKAHQQNIQLFFEQ